MNPRIFLFLCLLCAVVFGMLLPVFSLLEHWLPSLVCGLGVGVSLAGVVLYPYLD